MRRGKIQKRKLLPDPKYNDLLVSKFINILILKGKKSKAEKIVYNAMEEVSKKINKEPLEILSKAVNNVRPLLEVKARRIGGATYQVPIEVNEERGRAIALRWIRDFARVKKGMPMEKKLGGEILDAYKGEGASMKKRADTHKMAESNKAFAHFRF
ncbi:30S ribosomal protein S7 [bacterium Unc6]|nr:30S ribosomal protein S7 [bacterium Unc6]